MIFIQGRLLTLCDTGLICIWKHSKITLMQVLAFSITQTLESIFFIFYFLIFI